MMTRVGSGVRTVVAVVAVVALAATCFRLTLVITPLYIYI